ncbi:endonuclease domain-containing protein [Pelagibacterium sp. H642]|uniref:endonuclease domain-containing protein n=1 Tax=Pelagibacterium sp. H642 TaxID=1881069 RepID=UPI0028168442|nr:endonuclease domain-containing protein [Pelagibacterium sp. H642]WMT89630.1 endonuclease domain-containing protein [Pelagibacterium sp. H642]
MTTLKTKFAAKAAKALRGRMTDAEHKLWYHLRNRKFYGFKFVRQAPVGPYIADFSCREADLIVEVDGGQHAKSAHDAHRDTVFAEHGYAVLRFWNNDVLANIEGVLITLAHHLEKAPSPGLRYAKPDLSPKGEVKRRPSPLITSPLGGEVDAKRRVRGPLPKDEGTSS